jgi:putative ABC transport system permease protein
MHDWGQRIAAALASHGHGVDPDVVEELGQHAAAAYESARAEGLDAAQAAAHVDALIGEWTAAGAWLKHRARRTAPVDPPPAHGARWTGLLQEVRYAWRVSWRKPGPTVVASLTMALGIAATATLFSVTSGVLLKPLPWSEPETLIRMVESREGATRTYANAMTNGSYLAWASEPKTIESLGAYSGSTVTLTGAGDPQRVRIAAATASLFTVVRAVPARGSLFTAQDEAAANVAIISHAFWQRQFGGAEDVLGRTLTLDGKSRTIAGVMSPDFAFPDRDTVAWVPYSIRPSRTADGGSWIQLFSAIARLKPGVTPAQAAEEATARARSAPDPGMAVIALFGSKGPAVVGAQHVLDAATADVRDALWVMLAAVGLLLVAATANIASVQLARAASRRRELAIRVSLGATGGRLARQLVFESLVIGAVGGAVGLALAGALHAALPTLLPADFPRISDIALDSRVVLVSGLVSLLSSLAFGLVPAVQAYRLAPRSGMVEDAGATGTAFTRSATARLRAGIMAGQVAVACLLLVGAGLLGRTFVAMLQVDRGYDPAHVLTASIATPDGLFTPARRTALVERTLARLRSHPEVLFAASTNNLPLLPGESMMALTLPPSPGQSETRSVQTGFRLVSPGYFEAMGIKIMAGRGFDARDSATSMPSLVVNRAFAERYLPPGPIGLRLPVALYDKKPDWEIVGVVENVRMRSSLAEPPRPEIFVTPAQTPQGITGPPVLVLRTRGNPAAMMTELRTIVQGEESSAAIDSMMTMEDRVMGSLARPRLYAVVLAGFASFALAIAAVGLFGVLSYSVAQRSKELGVRTALGARPGQIVGMVVREGLLIAAIGLGAGLALAWGASRWLSSFLYGVSPADVWSYAGVAVLLLLIAALACVVPARRAARVDPLVVLKSS